jgi:hypothetical protein
MSLSISRITDTGESELCGGEGEPNPEEERPEGEEGPHHEPYTTVYTTGSSTVFINNLAVTTITSQGEQSCGNDHVSIATTGSATVFVENLGVHRVTDVGEGQEKDTYTSLTGSPDVFAG